MNYTNLYKLFTLKELIIKKLYRLILTLLKMEMCKNKTFEKIMNEKVCSYLWNIKNEHIIHECELIHCINNECIKKMLIQIYMYLLEIL